MASIESGGSWQQVPKFPLSNILRHDEKESVGPNNVRNYWRSPDSDPVFVLNLGCNKTYSAVQLVNARNRHFKDIGTRKFRLYYQQLITKTNKKTFPRLYSGQCKEGPWTKVLEKELEDPREQQDPLPLQIINLDKEATGQFLKFELLSWWGWNGGLMYFSIYHVDKA